MRVATEMDFELQPIDGTAVVAGSVQDALKKIRTVEPEKRLVIKLFMDVEFTDA